MTTALGRAFSLGLTQYLRPTPSASSGNEELGASAPFSRRERLALLISFALIVALRLPKAWVHGRFQDEEATVFFAYAWHHTWLDALFRTFGGYWNLGANAATLLDVELVRNGLLPLELAPYLTMSVALVFQLLPAVLILTGKAQWLAGRPTVIAALLMIAIMPATEEVFFNVLHIQFHLALCTALILALDVPRRRLVRFGYGVLLFLAPLCGPGAIVMVPLFALRGLIDRERGRLRQLAALASGAAVQLLLFYGSSPVRGHFAGAGTLAATIFVRLVALPAIGIDLTNGIARDIYFSQVAGTTYWLWFAAAAVVLLGVLTLVAAWRRDAAIWLVLSGLSIAATSFGFGMVIFNRADFFEILAGERYNFLPLVLLGLALIVLAMRPGFRGRRVCAALCALMLFNGAYSYPRPHPDFADGPSWPAEVAAWRKDHRHPLRVWPPYPTDLSDETRPCTPPGRDPGRSTDPRYCESGWIAAFYR
jgi:hypothetical protein